MAASKTRGQIIQPTETITLTVTFTSNGIPTDLATFPQISIIQPSGQVLFSFTGSGVYKTGTGMYGFDLTTGVNSAHGVWTDLWRGTKADGYDGYLTDLQERNFIVDYTELPGGPLSDGYFHLGDQVGFTYSQAEIFNINKLLKGLKARLNSAGLRKGTDQFGNPIYQQCDIYSIDTLVAFLAAALTEFNAIPHTTHFTFGDDDFIDTYYAVLIQGAVIWALASKALISRGMEFSLTDNGVSFSPPSISELLNTQYTTELANFTEKLKFIKNSMKPASLGVGGLTISTSRNPAVARLRHLRARQIF